VLRAVLYGVAFALSLAGVVAWAGALTPDPDQRWRVVVGGSSALISAKDRRWAQVFVARLRAHGGEIESYDVVPAVPAASVELNGEPSAHRVFRPGDAQRYLVIATEASRPSWLVDFESARVSRIALNGQTSIHPHPHEPFAVVIYTHGRRIEGIPVDEDGEPTVSGNEATWF